MKIRTATSISALVALLAGLLTVALATAAPPASADVGDVTVVWPQVTSFNPDTTDYVVDIQFADGPWTYWVTGEQDQWDYPDAPIRVSQRLDVPGQHAVEFSSAGAGGDLTLTVNRCDASGSNCSWVSTSPRLHVWRALEPTIGASYHRGPDTPVRLFVPAGTPERADADWELFNRQGVSIATGSMTDAPYVDGALPPVGPLPDMVEGAPYELRMTFSADVPPYGRLSGQDRTGFVWDSTPSPWVTTGMYSEDRGGFEASDVFYPVADGYGDTYRVRPDTTDMGRVRLEVRAPSGELVLDRLTEAPTRLPAEWTGLDADGNPLPEGIYAVTITTWDRASNQAVLTRDVTLSHQVVMHKVWRKSVTPAASMTERSVGRCAHLDLPARAGWPGSIAYRSEGCGERASLAATYHELVVPQSMTGRYGRVRLTVVGGAADGRSRLRTRLRQGDGRDTVWINAPRIGSGFGAHRGPWLADRVATGTGQPEVAWSVATDDRNRYDVKSFVVEVEYDVLGEQA